VDAQQLAGTHEVVELTSIVKIGAFSDGEKGIREVGQMVNFLGEKIEGNIAVSS